MMRCRRRLPAAAAVAAAMVIVLTVSPRILAATDSPSTAVDVTRTRAADMAYRDADWPAAVVAYEAITAAVPDDRRAWYRLAQARIETAQDGAAASALDRAEAAGMPAALVGVERARLALRAGDRSRAMAMLQAAVAGGYRNLSVLTGDAFAPLHDDAGFVRLVDGVRAVTRPCSTDARFRAFDFWLGDWDVELASGVLVGSNRIVAVEAGCALAETWRAAEGGTGSSLTFFAPLPGTWRQVWVGAAGTLIDIEGGPQAGSMVLRGTITYAATGKRQAFRGTWSPLADGRVRQLLEESADAGRTWTPWFEGFYRRQQQPPR